MFLVASDYDRTLANEKNGFIISDDVKSKVNEFSKKYPFVVVTGREKRFINVLANGLTPTAWVLENGPLLLIGEKEVYLVDKEWFEIREKIIEKLEKLGLRYSVGKIIIYLDNAVNFGNKLKFDCARVEWNRNDAMIMPKNMDKGKGLLELIKILKFNGKIIAVGDSQNDIPLFNVADFKVAVANALDEIKKIADLVLDEENGKGVISLLEMVESNYFLKKINID
ncbi:phosphoglycolate phosphatase [Acidianus sp. HS-5]|uniref:phosphoglycolate phosphatase n=1 Tax=Acidianus sp. HS-5 TaxID=2886040 RepID=UPI001F005DFD|nr:phosphoglycolate phosphatase [Acidianus sp. HS-5]BDC18344.1 phosphoglycolate phosphatase [Acidianus sp. HS-5]